MDSSKEFQLMLDKAIESEPLAFKDFDRTKNIQSQLQEMVNDFPEYPRGIINKLYAFADFVHKKPYLPKSFKDIEKDEACHFFTSMEQLWLAFVMKERFGKIWWCWNWLDKTARGGSKCLIRQ